jgi:hypothetical protein
MTGRGNFKDFARLQSSFLFCPLALGQIAHHFAKAAQGPVLVEQRGNHLVRPES